MTRNTNIQIQSCFSSILNSITELKFRNKQSRQKLENDNDEGKLENDDDEGKGV